MAMKQRIGWIGRQHGSPHGPPLRARLVIDVLAQTSEAIAFGTKQGSAG